MDWDEQVRQDMEAARPTDAEYSEFFKRLTLSSLVSLEHMLVDAQERVKHFQEVKPYYFKYNARMRQRTPKIPKRIRRWSHELGYYWQDNMRRYTETDRAYKNFSLAINGKPVVE